MSTKKYLDPEGMLKLIDGYLKKAGPTFQLKSTSKYLQLTAKNIEAAIHAHDRGKKYAVHSTQFPNEFFIPMGIAPLFNELYSTVVNMFSDDNQEFMNIADGMGFPCYNCSYYRSFYAMIEVGAWPNPDMICFSSSPCDQTPKGQEGAARAMGVPSFGLDRPYKLFTSQAQAYWKKEHEEFVKFLEQQTGKKMDYDHLKEVARLSYAATKLYIEVNELRAKIPTPLSAEASFAAMAAYRAWVGYPELVTFLTEFRDELKERVAKGLAAIPEERFRYIAEGRLSFHPREDDLLGWQIYGVAEWDLGESYMLRLTGNYLVAPVSRGFSGGNDYDATYLSAGLVRRFGAPAAAKRGRSSTTDSVVLVPCTMTVPSGRAS